MRALFKRFCGDKRGVSAVEFALMLPILLFVLVGSVTLFDLFRVVQAGEKSTFTVGDMLSRQQDAITDQELNHMVTFIGQTVDPRSVARLRVSSILQTASGLELDWSEDRGNEDVEMGEIPYDIIPDIAVGDSVLLTEVFMPHRAFVDWFGLDQVVHSHRAVHRPRFMGRIVYD